MLRKCAKPENTLVPQDRCPHPKEWCDCRCHPENQEDDERPTREDRRPVPVFAMPAPRTEPCPRGCGKPLALTGAGRSSHLRKHDRDDELAPPTNGTAGGQARETVTVGPVKTAEQIASEGRTHPVGDEPRPINLTLQQARDHLAQCLAATYTEEQKELMIALDTLDRLLGNRLEFTPEG